MHGIKRYEKRKNSFIQTLSIVSDYFRVDACDDVQYWTYSDETYTKGDYTRMEPWLWTITIDIGPGRQSKADFRSKDVGTKW